MEAKDIVFNALQDSGLMMKSKELVEKTGLEKKEVDKAIKSLKKDKLISSPKACYYSIPDNI